MAIKPVEILITAKDKASAVFGSLKATAIGAGIAIAGYFGIKAFAGAVEGAAELEAKLSVVRAVTQGTAADMEQLRKAAEDAGATTKFSATEAAEALGNLARAGLSSQQAIAALPATLALAQAGEVELGAAADFVTQALVGFRLEADQAGRVADVLALGANASKTSVTGLGQALSYAAPTAVSLGLSLESTVAIIGKFADAGIDASRAGTALNAILSQFSDPASKFRGELAAIGITTNDFEKALRQMAAAGPGAEKAILAVGTEAAPALRGGLNLGIAALDDLKGKLEGAAGSAKDFAATVEDNFTGASSSMASAWDTVKLALATPVLPILKDGIQQLTAALRGAVDNGTVGKFGDAIAKGFQAALTWGRAFLAEVDFDALAAKVGSAADQVGTAFDKVSTYATNTGNTVQTVWGVMGAGVNVVLTGIYALGTAFTATAATIVKGAIMASEALAKIAITDSAKAKLLDDAAAMREVLAGLTGVTQEFVNAANESMDGVATSVQLAREGWAGLTGANAEAAAQAATSQAAFKTVAETLKEVGGDATAAGQKQVAAAVLQTEAARKTRTEVAALKVEYEAAMQAGNVQVALEKLKLMQDALKKTAGAANTAAKGVKDAFERMGIQTKSDLKQAAENAKRDFDLIKGSGQATADGLRQAFQSYAEAAIAANGGVATESIRVEAAMRGLEIVTDSTGRTIVRAMTEGAGGMHKYRKSVDDAKQSVEDLAEAERKRLNVDKEGFTKDKSGNRLAMGGDLTTLTGINNFLKQAGLNDEQSKSLAREFSDSKGDIPYFSNPGQMKYGGSGSTMSEALLKAAERITFGAGQPGGAAGVGRTVVVKIDTGSGGTEDINTDEAGARALVRGLSKAARRAGR
ncbi:phage tail tape measure protein [Hydrogenophaga taeniospiralis]|uniref:phage tail tape measure protein n=1 Tax=Hydrogenophaga taeniospiralis TaxID=65656 RepID=UPI001CF9FA0D|nr:phage tail tape measure protein [Hydrogenophaga taeniospiralis]UCU94016.1 phage tail tape measure protein [Hydrogenophaga taeniospiralis]